MVAHYCSQLRKGQRKSGFWSVCMRPLSLQVQFEIMVKLRWSCVFGFLHQLCLVNVSDPSLQLLWMFREKLELGAVTFRMLPWVVITNLSWSKGTKKVQTYSQTSKVKPDVMRSFRTTGSFSGEDGLNMSGLICVPSCHTALPQMTLMPISLCKELTRQPIFNSSASPLEEPACAFSDSSSATILLVCCACLGLDL